MNKTHWSRWVAVFLTVAGTLCPLAAQAQTPQVRMIEIKMSQKLYGRFVDLQLFANAKLTNAFRSAISTPLRLVTPFMKGQLC